MARLTHKKELKGYDARIKESQKEWAKLTKEAEKLRKDLEPLINSEREKNSQNISAFEEQLKGVNNAVKDEAYQLYETGTEKSYEGLDQFANKLDQLSQRLEQFQFLANGFDDEAITNGCRALLEKMNLNYNSMRELWDHIKLTLTRFNEIYNRAFEEAKTEEIEDT